MSNPLRELKDAAVQAAAELAGVGAADTYDGEKYEDLVQQAVRNRAAGASVWARVYGGERADRAPQGNDRSDTLVQWMIAAPILAGTRTAHDAALDVLWIGYDELVGTTLGLDWIWPLSYRGWQTVHQQTGCCIVSLITATWIDMANHRG